MLDNLHKVRFLSEPFLDEKIEKEGRPTLWNPFFSKGEKWIVAPKVSLVVNNVER